MKKVWVWEAANCNICLKKAENREKYVFE